jgi:hypothetical protein
MWSLANGRQEAFLIILATLGISSFFYGMLTSMKKPGNPKLKK